MFHLKKITNNSGDKLKILLIGYNGAANTGSEARLLATIEDIRALLGQKALVTVPTLFENNLRRYIQESPELKIAPFNPIYFRDFYRLIKENDLVLLIEGSCYMDTWSCFLFWAWLWATRCAYTMRKPVVAYAVDSGDLSRANQKHLCRIAGKTNLIITRTRPAAERIKTWGVTAPLEVTADTAFAFQTDPSDEGLLNRIWPEATTGIAGIAAVDFYRWPVVARLWGRKEDCYRWPYYFSKSSERTRSSDALAKGLAELADDLVQKTNKSIALICMEQLDEPMALKIKSRMTYGDRARIFSAREYNASQITVILRSLDLLITSRYHAGVLSLAAGVPQAAVGHDYRLADLYEELGIKDEFFINYQAPNLFTRLSDLVKRLIDEETVLRARLETEYQKHLERATGNRILLQNIFNSTL